VERVRRGFSSRRKKEAGWQSVYLQFTRWCKDGSFRRLWDYSILAIKAELDLSAINLDGTQTLAKKGGESVAYQGRKKGKTSNILPVTDVNGYIIGSTGILAGNHNDAYELKNQLQMVFKEMKRLGLEIQGAYLNADSSFDTKEARKTCFNYGVIPNISENQRGRKNIKRGRKRLFNETIYHQRYCAERTFAWVDSYKRLLIRFERKDGMFLGAHHLAFAMINLRSILVKSEEGSEC
jgi:transposase